MQKIYLAVVAYGGVEPLWVQSLCDLIVRAGKLPIHVVWNPGDSLVSRSRNTITAHFLKSDCTDLLFIDTDIGFTPEQVHRLCQHDVDIVAGFYPKKGEGPVQWVCNGFETPSPIQPDGLQKLRYMGTGFMRIRRRVFDQMIGRYPEIEFIADETKEKHHDFWGVGVYTYKDGSKRYLSEDWMFCQRALDMGFDVFGDTQIMLRHVGKLTFPNIAQMEQIRAANEKAAAPISASCEADGRTVDDSPPSLSDRTSSPLVATGDALQTR